MNRTRRCRQVGRAGLAVVVVFAAACDRPPARKTPVGRRTLAVTDPDRSHYVEDRPRPVLTHVWYPAKRGAEESAWNIGVFKLGYGAVDAPIAASADRRPLIVMSHGTGGAAAQLSWVAEALATHGYVVAAANHHGNTAAEDRYLPQGFVLWWERARDLSVIVDQLLADDRFGPLIDPARIGAVGFSLGGYSVLVLAGARTDLDRWRAFCAEHPHVGGCTLPPESPFDLAQVERLVREDAAFKASYERAGASYADPRIGAAYVMAPALAFSLDPMSLADVSIPVKIVVGAHDDQADAEYGAKPVADAIPGAALEILPKTSHYTFLAECTLRGRWFVSSLCGEPGGADRQAVHRRVAADVRAFFEREFGGGPS